MKVLDGRDQLPLGPHTDGVRRKVLLEQDVRHVGRQTQFLERDTDLGGTVDSMDNDDELECHFCGAWCMDTDDELVAWCDICDAVICFDCQAVVTKDGPEAYVECIECQCGEAT